MKSVTRVCLLILYLFGGALLLRAEQTEGHGWIWWEAEDFTESNWPGGKSGKGPFQPKTDDQKSRVSNGVWLTSFKADRSFFLEYSVKIKADGSYTLWSRNFATPHGGTRTPYRWRFDDGKWFDQKKNSGNAVNMEKPIPKTTLKWIRLEDVELKAGTHRFRLEVTDPAAAAGFDCFLLSRVPFVPNGTLKPGQKLGLAEDGKWAFEPDQDPYKDSALLDLRGLNEKVAGQNGYVRRSPQGDGFVLGDGTPVKFWSVEFHPGPGIEDAREQASFLSKRGVNAVRFFVSVEESVKDGTGHEIKGKARDALWRTVAAMREQGIYTMITPFWLYNNTTVYPDWGWENWQGTSRGKFKRPNGSIFIDPDYQEAYKAWLRQIMAPPNPYTGIPLAQDASIYCLQIQNEHSILWSWVWGSPPKIALKLGRDFGTWATKKYGSLDKALEAWGGERVTENKPVKGVVGDDFARGIAGLPPHYGKLKEYASRRLSPGLNARYSDFLEFFAGYMRDFHSRMADYFRDELGYKGLVSANNWKGQGANLTDLEHFTYTVNAVMDYHNYFGYPSQNPKNPRASGYSVNDGDRYVDRSGLFEPIGFCTSNKMLAGFPTTVSEGSWLAPMSYRSEAPLMIASYGSLIGLDMFDHFAWASNTLNWDSRVTKFGLGTPCYVGQFPANALIYRHGYVSEASEPAILETRSLQEIYDRKEPIITRPSVRDPNRAEEEAEATEGGQMVSQTAYLVGPVLVQFAEKPAKPIVADIDKYVDEKAKTIRAITGEMEIDYGQALFKLSTARAQAVSGYLDKVGEFRLDDVTITSRDHYATVVVVSMDRKPIRSSQRLLVQVGTRCRPYNWQDKDNVMVKPRKKSNKAQPGKEIITQGRMPWNVTQADLKVEIRNSAISKATVCDANGYPVKEIELTKSANGISFQFPKDALYVVLQ